MNAGDGDDVYVVDTTADQIIEALNGGLDTVVIFADTDYTLASQCRGALWLSFYGRAPADRQWQRNNRFSARTPATTP